MGLNSRSSSCRSEAPSLIHAIQLESHITHHTSCKRYLEKHLNMGSDQSIPARTRAKMTVLDLKAVCRDESSETRPINSRATSSIFSIELPEGQDVVSEQAPVTSKSECIDANPSASQHPDGLSPLDEHQITHHPIRILPSFRAVEFFGFAQGDHYIIKAPTQRYQMLSAIKS
jgi:hypothetical protein